MNYYSENDPRAAAWIRELIADGLIPNGYVDERSITDVRPTDLLGFDQYHFFCGIAGWARALRIAGWPDDRPIATASLPCQPWSGAGLGLGIADDRHLWPSFYRLAEAMRWPVIIGEQVASAAVVGRVGKKAGRGDAGAIETVWLDGIQADMEAQSYTCGATVLGAHSIGAPHIRQRVFWMAVANGGQSGNGGIQRSGQHGFEPQDGGVDRMEYATRDGREQRRPESSGRGVAGGCGDGSDRLAEPDDAQRRTDMAGGNDQHGTETGWQQGDGESGERGADGGMANAKDANGRSKLESREQTRDGRSGFAGIGPWSDFDIIQCRDGKVRRIPRQSQSVLPGVVARLPDGMDAGGHQGYAEIIAEAAKGFPLAKGIKGRTGLLRGVGNAINPHLAAEFIGAVMEILDFSAFPAQRAETTKTE